MALKNAVVPTAMWIKGMMMSRLPSITRRGSECPATTSALDQTHRMSVMTTPRSDIWVDMYSTARARAASSRYSCFAESKWPLSCSLYGSGM